MLLHIRPGVCLLFIYFTYINCNSSPLDSIQKLANKALGPNSGKPNLWYTDITNIIKSSTDEIVMAFADMNSDRHTDILLLNQNNSIIVILMGLTNIQRHTLTNDIPKKGTIQSIIAADFNGDCLPDVMICMGDPNVPNCFAHVAFAVNDYLHLGNFESVAEFKTQPLLLDWNVDRIPDLYGEDLKGERIVWYGRSMDKMASLKILKSSKISHMAMPAFTAFVDLTQDNNPDILTTVKDNGKVKFQVISNVNGAFPHEEVHFIDLPPKTVIFGQPCFGDFNFIGKIEMILPVCEDSKCVKSHLYMYSFDKRSWKRLTVSGRAKWNFLPAARNPLLTRLQIPPLGNMIVADANLDTFPDLLVVAEQTSNGIRRVGAILFLNRGKGKFDLQFLEMTGTPALAAFFDFGDDGNLDIITTWIETGQQKSHPKLGLFKYTSSVDNYFVKVMVVSGLACTATGPLPYGLPDPGASICYLAEAWEGGRQTSRAVITPQTAYGALQLPFVVFGFGGFTNYLESLIVRLPSAGVIRQHEFKFVVPKTQLIIVPRPLNVPSKWRAVLFMYLFSFKVLTVGLTLLCTFLGGILIVSAFQLFEYFQDRKDRLHESHKFHFDAM